MKYLEELSHGESFTYENNIFLLTSDFKKDDTKLCYNLSSGFAKWIKSDAIVDICPIYTLNKENNIVPIKEYKKSDV